MKKCNFALFVLIFIIPIIYGCNSNSNKKISKKSVLQFAQFNHINDMYPEPLFQYFKKHRIKTISFVLENVKTGELDSLTYLKINKTGKLIQRTTKECTTIGCLPYMNRQEYIYSNNKIKRIDIYVFKNHEQSVHSEWLSPDTSELYKFDWNTYTYNQDTTFVESAISEWKFINNSKGEVITRELRVKSSNQYIFNSFLYTDSTIKTKDSNSFDKTEYFSEEFRYKGNRIELWLKSRSISGLIESWIVDSQGLITKIIHYNDRKIISLTHISYSFFN